MDKETPTNPMNLAPRCGAKNRQGNPCQAPAMRGRARCRLHGGKATGAPKGEKNGAYKHGQRTKEAEDMRREIMALIKDSRAMARDVGL